MKKLLIIPYELEAPGVQRGPHTFCDSHLKELQAVAGGAMEITVALPQDAEQFLAQAHAIAGFPSTMPDVAKAPNAEWLHSFSAGVDRVLTPAVATSDILVSNSSGVHRTPIAEHIIGFMLMFTRGFSESFKNQEKHLWQKAKSLDEICDKVVLIVGLGEIGTEAARLSAAFHARVWAVSRSPKEKPDFVEKIGTHTDLEAMLPEADFVVITLPHTDATHHLFNASLFSKMKLSAVVINIGRGGIINEPDLINALQAGTIQGAGLDVTETEPLPASSPLWDMPNVIITPHHSGLSDKYMDRAVEVLCRNIKAFIEGGKLPTQVDKELGY